jgi:PAS domain-containing protein
LFCHDLAEGRRVWHQLFDAGRLHIDTEERRLDGSTMMVEGDYICLYDGQGRITGHFGIQRDVTDRKQAALALRESEQRFRAVLETMPLIGVMLDLQGRILLGSDFLLELTGWQRHEVLGQDWLQTFIPATFVTKSPPFLTRPSKAVHFRGVGRMKFSPGEGNAA